MTAPTRKFIDHLETPIGRLVLLADGEGRLRACGFGNGHHRMDRLLAELPGEAAVEPVPAANPGGLTELLERYFSGDLRALEAIPVAFGGTDFQSLVWRTLQEIPCGETWSYADLARRIGRPKAVRAVGLANGQNPISIVVPCHRVIGSSGELTGYGGGLERKRWLLDHERATGRKAQMPLFA